MISIVSKKIHQPHLLFFCILLTIVQMNIFSQKDGFPPYIGQSGIQNSAWEFLLTIAKHSLTPETQVVPSHIGIETSTALLQIFPTYSLHTDSKRSIPLLVDQLVQISIPNPDNPVVYDVAVPATLPYYFKTNIEEINKTQTIFLTKDLNDAIILLLDNQVGSIISTAIQAFDFFHPDPNYQSFNPTDFFPDNDQKFQIESISPGTNIHLESADDPSILPPINWFVRIGRHNGQYRELFDRWYTFNPELPIIWNIESFYPEID